MPTPSATGASSAPPAPWYPRTNCSRCWAAPLSRCMSGSATRAGKARWADKNPENVLYWRDWDRLLGRDWLFVHMVRHPLDTLASIKEANFPFALPRGLEGRIGHYRQCLLQGQLFGKTYPDRYLLVRYEELARAPGRVLELLMKGLGETLEPIQLSFNEVAHEKGLEDPKVGATRAV